MNWPQHLIAVLLGVVLAACASTPKFDLTNVDTFLTPKTATAPFDTARNKRVLWGGLIISSKIFQNGTQLEILAYPLDGSQRPNKNAEPVGRFLARYNSILDAGDYATGRSVTLVGILIDTKEGRADEAVYVYPLVKTEQIHLWPKPPERDNDAKFHFGVGVILH